MQQIILKISARNVLNGAVRSLDVGVGDVEVAVEISSGLDMTSIITKKSCEHLGLKIGGSRSEVCLF